MAATVTGILLTGNHAGRPSSGVSAGTLYSCTTHSLIYQTSDTGSTWATWATLGTGGSVTSSEAFITGDVAISADTFADGPSKSLAAGTYDIEGHVSVTSATAGTFATAKLWDGTNVWDTDQSYLETSGGPRTLFLSAKSVVLGSTTTVKISVATHTNTGTIKTTAAFNGTTNKLSRIGATKIA